MLERFFGKTISAAGFMMLNSVPETGCRDTLGCHVNLFGFREISRILIKRSRFIISIADSVAKVRIKCQGP